MTSLDDLASEVAHLTDRMAILDVINRHARGCDRHDADLISSAYWPDAVDEHGSALNSGTEYAGWANASHAATSSAHLHHITTHTCELDGDTAHAETYVLVVLLAPDERTVQVMTGRYVDRLERRHGEWRIALRRSTVEASFGGDAAMLHHPFFRQQAYPKGSHDHDDLSYARPLTLEAPAPSAWE